MIGSKALQVAAMEDFVNRSHADQAQIIDDLRKRLFEANKKRVYRKSAKEALAKMVDEIVDEVAGKRPVRLSDPKNTDLRNAFYVDTMAKQVITNSTGIPPGPHGERIEMDNKTIQEFKAKRQIK